MFTCDFEPTICKSNAAVEATEDTEAVAEVVAKYSGKIKLKPLSYEDRLDLIEQQTIIQAEAGDDDQKKMMALLKFAKDFARHRLADFFVSSTLVRLEDGYAFDSLEKIKYDGPTSNCIPEVSTAIISGELSLGK